jgi:hypothetical protein
LPGAIAEAGRVRTAQQCCFSARRATRARRRQAHPDVSDCSDAKNIFAFAANNLSATAGSRKDDQAPRAERRRFFSGGEADTIRRFRRSPQRKPLCQKQLRFSALLDALRAIDLT